MTGSFLEKIPALIPPDEMDIFVDKEHKSVGGPLPDTSSCSSGINIGKANWGISFLAPVLEYLNKLDYGPTLTGDSKATDPWDCEDKAFWAIAHARRKFPGLPMAVAEGIGRVGDGIKGQPHAIVLMWWVNKDNKKDYLFYDPGLKQTLIDKTNDFGPINRITAFPTAKRAAPNIIPPLDLKTINMDLFGHSITMDNFVSIYPMRAKDNKGIGVLDFLQNDLHDRSCVNKGLHGGATDPGMSSFYMDTDRALWTFAHVRRSFPGCAIGIALGIPKDGKSQAVNMIWQQKGSKPLFWDPKINEEKGGLVNDFEIKASFM